MNNIKEDIMKIIDADELMNDINNAIDEMTKIGIVVDGSWLWEKLNNALDNASTIKLEQKTEKWISVSERLPKVGQSVCGTDAEIIYTRKWIKHGIEEGHLIEKYTCSECDYYSGTKTTNFCPNWGVDMRGEKDE